MIVGTSMTWLTSTVCCKLSILALYTSLFRTFRPIRILVWTVGGLVVCYFVAFLIAIALGCISLTNSTVSSPSLCDELIPVLTWAE